MNTKTRTALILASTLIILGLITLFIHPEPGMLFCDERKKVPVPFILPLEGEVITSFRQEYHDDVKDVNRKHTGIDISGTKGQEVLASGNGLVSYIGISPIGGRTIVIRHNEKIKTTYLNLENIFVSVGQKVSQRQVIASIGASDDPSSPKPHLHFAIVFKDKYLDPVDVTEIDYDKISKFIVIEHVDNDFNISRSD